MGDKVTTLDSLKEGAMAELRERLGTEWPGRNEFYDIVHELADSWVPIYTRELCELAGDIEIFTHESELGDPKTIEQHVQYACYELLSQHLGGAEDDLRAEISEANEAADEEGEGDD